MGKFGEVDGEFRNVKMVGTVERAWECGEQGFFATSAKAEIDSVGFFNGAVGFFFFPYHLAILVEKIWRQELYLCLCFVL